VRGAGLLADAGIPVPEAIVAASAGMPPAPWTGWPGPW
jgi:hypothetical protein